VGEIEIRQTRYGAPSARVLVEAAMAELGERYGGGGDATPVEAVEFDPPEGCFVVAWLDGAAVACGGWRTLAHAGDLVSRGDGSSSDAEVAEDVAEIKRMYTTPTARKSGVATRVLRALEDNAREAGMHRVVLETGDRQPDAIAFYVKNGYERIMNYGYYKDEPGCVSFGRDL
jgi:GNAT superfamily N-acetyltransferase